MAIIRTGAEVSDYNVIVGAFGWSQSTSRMDDRFSRVAIHSATQTPQYQLKLYGSYDDVWLHVYMRAEPLSTAENTSRTKILTFYNSTNSRPQYAFVSTEDPGVKYMFVKYDAAGNDTVLIDDIAYNSFSDVKSMDIQVNAHATTGSAKVYIDGVLVGSFTGDTSIPDSDFDEIILSSGKGGRDTYYSEVIVADESTLGMRLATLHVTSDDATVDWTGSYASVDEITNTGIDYLASDVTDATVTMGLANVDSEISGWDVVSVNVSSKHMLEVGSTVNDVQHLVKVGGTLYPGASLTTPKDGLFDSYQTKWATNPSSTNAWTLADLDALIAGAKVVA